MNSTGNEFLLIKQQNHSSSFVVSLFKSRSICEGTHFNNISFIDFSRKKQQTGILWQLTRQTRHCEEDDRRESDEAICTCGPPNAAEVTCVDCFVEFNIPSLRSKY